jgi:hypothetical protein
MLSAVRIDYFKYRFTDQLGRWLGATQRGVAPHSIVVQAPSREALLTFF